MPRLPESIGKYKILERLGRGGMSVVYKAQHPTLETPVVLKKLMLKGDSSHRERFRREAALMMRLRHPNVVGVFDHFKEGGSHYLVMEYVDGRPLSELLAREGSFPPKEAAWLVAQIAAALSHIHSQAVVHRDVKPSNILLAKDGSVKLGDFGIAFSPLGDQDITAQGTALGTPSFMSPEQLEDARSADARSDIWSLGVCLFELLTGRKFVTGPTPAAIREALPLAVRGMSGRLPPKVPFRLKRFLQRSLRLRPASRMRDGGAALRMLGLRLYASDPPSELQDRMDALFMANGHDERTPQAGKIPLTRAVSEADGESPKRKRRPKKKKQNLTKRLSPRDPSGATGSRQFLRSRFLSRPLFYAVILPAAAIVGLLLILPGAWDVLFRSDSYGMLKLELEYSPDTPEYWLSGVEAHLYREEAGTLRSVFSPVLKPAPDNRNALLSRRISLPAGAYRLRWNLGDKVSWHSFHLESNRNQKHSGIKQTLLTEELGPPPVFPLNFSWSATDAMTHTDISGHAVLHIDRIDAPGAPLESGGSYRFQVDAPGYRTSIFSIPVSPWRRQLHLAASLWPEPARLIIENTTDRAVSLRLNGSKRYTDMSGEPDVRVLGRLQPEETQYLSLMPGDYLLTHGMRKTPVLKLPISVKTETRLKVIRNAAGKIELVLFYR